MRILIVTLFAAASFAASAATKDVTLKIDKMSCASCPYIVKQSISKLDGVSEVNVSYKDKTAQVVYDDSKTTVDAIAAASTDQGYPATLVEETR